MDFWRLLPGTAVPGKHQTESADQIRELPEVDKHVNFGPEVDVGLIGEPQSIDAARGLGSEEGSYLRFIDFCITQL